MENSASSFVRTAPNKLNVMKPVINASVILKTIIFPSLHKLPIVILAINSFSGPIHMFSPIPMHGLYLNEYCTDTHISPHAPKVVIKPQPKFIDIFYLSLSAFKLEPIRSHNSHNFYAPPSVKGWEWAHHTTDKSTQTFLVLLVYFPF